jgi:hypothetical protein
MARAKDGASGFEPAEGFVHHRTRYSGPDAHLVAGGGMCRQQGEVDAGLVLGKPEVMQGVDRVLPDSSSHSNDYIILSPLCRCQDPAPAGRELFAETNA